MYPTMSGSVRSILSILITLAGGGVCLVGLVVAVSSLHEPAERSVDVFRQMFALIGLVAAALGGGTAYLGIRLGRWRERP